MRQIAGQPDLTAVLIDDDRGICIDRLDGASDAAGAAAAAHVGEMETHDTFHGLLSCLSRWELPALEGQGPDDFLTLTCV